MYVFIPDTYITYRYIWKLHVRVNQCNKCTRCRQYPINILHLFGQIGDQRFELHDPGFLLGERRRDHDELDHCVGTPRHKLVRGFVVHVTEVIIVDVCGAGVPCVCVCVCVCVCLCVCVFVCVFVLQRNRR